MWPAKGGRRNLGKRKTRIERSELGWEKGKGGKKSWGLRESGGRKKGVTKGTLATEKRRGRGKQSRKKKKIVVGKREIKVCCKLKHRRWGGGWGSHFSFMVEQQEACRRERSSSRTDRNQLEIVTNHRPVSSTQYSSEQE